VVAPDDIELSSFSIGDLVLKSYPQTLLHGKPSKLHPYWKGPFQVHQRSGDHYVLIDLLSGMKEPTVHISRLKPFRYDERRTNPRLIASNNTDDEFLVEAILAHRTIPRTPFPNDIMWEVRWSGEDQTTWATTEQLRDVEPFHKYCMGDRKLIKYIPQKFRDQYGLTRRRNTNKKARYSA
jgi:hypothetical protein